MNDPIASRRPFALARFAGMLALALSLGACSTVGDFFSGEDSKDPPPEQAKDQAKGDGDKSPPKLSTVPDRPKTQTTPTQRQGISQGIRSDKDNARYGGDVAAQDESGDAKLGQRLPGSPPPAQGGDQSAPPPAATPAAAPPPPAAPPRGPVAGGPAPVPPPMQQAAVPPPTSYGYSGFAGRGSSLQVAVIQFNRGAAALSGEDRAVLREVADIHKRNGGSIRVYGYSEDDAQGVSAQAQMTSFTVANARANAVASELIRLGVARDAIQVQAFGDATAAPVGTAQATSARRADIFMDF